MARGLLFAVLGQIEGIGRAVNLGASGLVCDASRDELRLEIGRLYTVWKDLAGSVYIRSSEVKLRTSGMVNWPELRMTVIGIFHFDGSLIEAKSVGFWD